jgi:DTW domain-containing protein YfiP
MLCPTCGKPAALCVCAAIEPIDTRLSLLILQHPQEQDRALGTARLAARLFPRAQLAIGLSWSSLAASLGRAAEPRQWGTLHPVAGATGPRIGVAGLSGAAAEAALAALDGIILLDGSWSQAKALWWRNPWLLKTRRLTLDPPFPSLYGELRREPRASALATLEAAAFCLAELEGDPTILERARVPFQALLDRYRANAPPPRPGADRRRVAQRRRFR